MQPSEQISSTSRELDDTVQAILTGDPRAVVTLYELTVGAVHQRAKNVCADAARCLRAVQTVYMAVPKNITAFDPSQNDVTSWLQDNVVRTLMRSDAAGAIARDEQTWRRVEAGEESKVQAALQQLAPLSRTLVEFAFFERLTDAQMADRLSMPVDAVAFHLRRARAQLHARLAADLLHEAIPVSAQA